MTRSHHRGTRAAQQQGGGRRPEPEKVSAELARWLAGDGEKTLGSLIELFEQKSFAIVFVLLLGVPALPLPTGGATHVFEIIAMLLALELLVGRAQIWLPERWRGLELAGGRRQRLIAALMKLIGRLGSADRDPFVLTPDIEVKLAFIDELVRARAGKIQRSAPGSSSPPPGFTIEGAGGVRP